MLLLLLFRLICCFLYCVGMCESVGCFNDETMLMFFIWLFCSTDQIDVTLFIHSFLCSIVRSFRSIIRSFVHLFTHSVVELTIYTRKNTHTNTRTLMCSLFVLIKWADEKNCVKTPNFVHTFWVTIFIQIKYDGKTCLCLCECVCSLS